MNVDWQRVKELFNEAVELPVQERDPFLSTACAGDANLRREIDALLAADAEVAEFLPEPVPETGTTAGAADIPTEPRERHEVVSSGKLRFCPRCSGRFSTADIVCPVDGEVLVEDPEALVDTTIDGLYQVIRLIGRGGFGVVYLARHALLRDLVAIKVLPRQLSSDPERIERFLREGRAARAIRHPNLVSVYDLRATGDGLTYMVQEYVEGHTLRNELELRGKFAPTDVLSLLEPIASALDEAHAHGIVHRDLKPDNIMLSVSGTKRSAKLLDLGIVKLAEILSEPSAADHNVTHPGHFIGTPSYMSPEQWGTPPEDGGPDIDGRADVYSFGVVVFEMLTGRQPFRGRTMSEIRRAHLVDPPPIVSEFDPTLSMEFSATLARALAKVRAERPATAGTFVKELRSALEGTDRLALAGQAGASSRFTSLPTREIPPTDVAVSTVLDEPNTVPAGRRWHTIRSIAAAVAIAAVLGVAGYGAWRFVQPLAEPPSRPSVVEAGELITNTGSAIDAAISPDGSRVATVSRAGSQYQLSVVHIPTRATMPLGAPTDARLHGLTFSPDGNYVYYVEEPAATGPSVLTRISIGGGTPQRILTSIESAVTFSPAGDRLAYVRDGTEPGVREIAVASVDGSSPQMIATTSGQQLFPLEAPSWSPDGALIACSVMDMSAGIRGFVTLVNVADETMSALTTPDWYYVGRVQWLSDGRRLMASAAKEPLGAMQLWEIEYPSGVATHVRPDINSNDGVSVSTDMRALVSVRTSIPTSLWTATIPGGSDGRQLPLGVTRYFGVSWTPDGRLLFASTTRGTSDIWISDADGRNARQLTFEESTERDPVMSPDGRYILFVSNRAGTFNVWRMNADGSDARQITFGRDDEFPSCSPDSSWIAYQGFENQTPGIWRIGIDGGEPTHLGLQPALWPTVSPDGQFVACLELDGRTQTWRATIIPTGGGAARRLFEVSTLQLPRLNWQRVRWTADGRSLTYLVESDGRTILRSTSLEGGATEDLAAFPAETVFHYDVRDSVLVCSRSAVTSDIVLLTGF